MPVVRDAYLVVCKFERPRQGRCMNGRTPLQAFEDGIRKAAKKEGHPERTIAT